jgi:large subunit ribosomal protein L25
MADKLLHIDFHEVSLSQKVITVVSLEFFKEAIDGKQNRDVFDIVHHEVNAKCLPSDLLSSIGVDISDLNIGTVAPLSNLVVSGGVELIGDHASPIVSRNSVAAQEKANEAVPAETTATEGVAPKTKQEKITANSLIIGLGSPGTEYDFTRHNMGFLIIDAFANENGSWWTLKKA